MLPAPPLPDNLSTGRHLDKIGGIHFAVVVFRARSSSSDLSRDLVRKWPGADENYIAVSQTAAVVIVIGVPDFPQNSSLPINFERDTACVRRLPDMRGTWNFAIIKERAAIGKIPVSTRPVWHPPTMDYAPL